MTREQLIQEIIPKMKRVLRSGKLASYAINDQYLTLPQLHLLFHVSKEKTGVTMKELAEHLCVTGGAVTQFIDDLVEKDMLVREHDAADRRSVKVRLSKKGEEHFTNFKREYLKVLTPRFAHLTDEELEMMIKLLNKITIS